MWMKAELIALIADVWDVLRSNGRWMAWNLFWLLY